MKHILLAVCGLSPQVITETLYALHQQGRMIDAIRILTTQEGRTACIANLLDPVDGHYHRFLADYAIAPGTVDFSSRHVVAVTDQHGRTIGDIGSEEDNEIFLQACMEETFRLTSDPRSSIAFSIAGGRKTMGAALALAAQYYGRPQDRVYHVLVSPEFESCREFYYPPPVSRMIELRERNGTPFFMETRYARISLAHMPFPSLRDRLSDKLLRQPEEPSALLMSLVREDKPELILDLQEGRLLWKGVQLDLPPTQCALYAFFLLRKKSCEQEKPCQDCNVCFLETTEVLNHQHEIGKLYHQISSKRTAMATSDTGILGLSQENFNAYKSKLNRAIEKQFGRYEADKLNIVSHGQRPGLRHGVELDKGLITIVM